MRRGGRRHIKLKLFSKIVKKNSEKFRTFICEEEMEVSKIMFLVLLRT